MRRLRLLAAPLTAVLVAALTPAATAATGGHHHQRHRASAVDFGTCTEFANGTTAALSELQERVPASVPVLSLADQGIVFPGSDELGTLITRVLECESISVTRKGRTRTQQARHIAHVGTPVDVSGLPATPFSTDGGNGADFSNYIFGYYSDSRIFVNALRRAGIRGAAPARISLRDEAVEECVVDRTVTVRPRSRRHNYGFTATGVVPEAACEPSVVPFVGNWWSVRHGKASVLSNNIVGQSAVFIDPADAVITIEAGRRSQLADVLGARTRVADAFGFTGLIPETDGIDEVVTPVG